MTSIQYDIRYLETNTRTFNEPRSQIVKYARLVTELILRFIRSVCHSLARHWVTLECLCTCACEICEKYRKFALQGNFMRDLLFRDVLVCKAKTAKVSPTCLTYTYIHSEVLWIDSCIIVLSVYCSDGCIVMSMYCSDGCASLQYIAITTIKTSLQYTTITTIHRHHYIVIMNTT